MRRFSCAVLLAVALAGCASPSGEPAAGFLNASVAQAFIAVRGQTFMFNDSASAFVIEPGIAVTNVHVADFFTPPDPIGRSHDYDLMYFRVSNNAAPATAAPRIGEHVIAYGNALDGSLRVAHGVVKGLDMPVEARCRTCAVQAAFIFEGDAGPGFSGGPVLDAETGTLVGITFGYSDVDGKRLNYAYPMSRVRNELAALLHRLPAP